MRNCILLLSCLSLLGCAAQTVARPGPGNVVSDPDTFIPDYTPGKYTAPTSNSLYQPQPSDQQIDANTESTLGWALAALLHQN